MPAASSGPGTWPSATSPTDRRGGRQQREQHREPGPARPAAARPGPARRAPRWTARRRPTPSSSTTGSASAASPPGAEQQQRESSTTAATAKPTAMSSSPLPARRHPLAEHDVGRPHRGGRRAPTAPRPGCPDQRTSAMSSTPTAASSTARDVAGPARGDRRHRHRPAELDRHRGAQRQPGDRLVEGEVHQPRWPARTRVARTQPAPAPGRPAAGAARPAAPAAAPSSRSTATAEGDSRSNSPTARAAPTYIDSAADDEQDGRRDPAAARCRHGRARVAAGVDQRLHVSALRRHRRAPHHSPVVN